MLDQVLKDRTRLPAMVNRTIDHVADHPMSPIGRLAALRYGVPRDQDRIGVSIAPEAPRQLLIAPVNYSGQGTAWSRAISSPEVAAVNMAVEVPGGFSFPADLVVPVPVYQNGHRWQRRQLEAASRFSHVLVEASEPPFGRLLGRDVSRQQDALRQRGVSIAHMAHGTEVRSPRAHAERTPWSPYRDSAMYTQRLERVVTANLLRIEQSGEPVFVSTPDLLSDIPGGIWCPVVIAPELWGSLPVASAPQRLRVVHSPSVSSVKGTHLVEPVLQRLHNRGVVDYRRISGVPWSRMPEVFGEADVVLDQFRLGSYGVAACEAMAAGRIVVGHVLPDVRRAVLAATGLPLPVVEATPASLESVLLELASNPHATRDVAERGREFAIAVHDGRLSARLLTEHWIDRRSRI